MPSVPRFLSASLAVVVTALLFSACERPKEHLWRASSKRFRNVSAEAAMEILNKRKAAETAAAKKKLSDAKKKVDKKEKKLDPVAEFKPKVLAQLEAIGRARKAYDAAAERRAMESLQGFPIKAVEPTLLDVLKKNPDGLGTQAARVLGSFKDKRFLAPLVNALKGTDLFVAEAAALALGTTGEDGAIMYLVAQIGAGGAISVRAASIRALGTLGNTGAVEPLLEALEDGDADIRRAAAVALGALKDQRALEPLKTMLGEAEDALTKVDLATALLGLGWPDALRELAKLLWGVKAAKARAWQTLKRHTDRMRVQEALFDVLEAEKAHAIDLKPLVVEVCNADCYPLIKKRRKASKDAIVENIYKMIMQDIKAKLQM